MADWEIYLVIALLSLATAITRSGFAVFGNRVDMPPRVRAALRFAPACALAAIIVPDLLLLDGQLQLSLDNHKLLAGAVAIVFHLYKKDMLLTILFGMLCFSVLRLYA